MSIKTQKEAYFLYRPCFELNPFEDGVIYFGRDVLLDRLEKYVKLSWRQDKGLKLVLEGSWGFGKTHTLSHIAVNPRFGNLMEGVYVHLYDLSGKESPYEGFFWHILKALLRTGHLRQYSKGVRSDRDQANLLKQTAGLFIYNAIYGLTDPDTGEIAERWLLGERLTRSDARGAGLSEGISDDEARELLACLGRYFWEVNKKMLVLLLDEAHRLQQITEDSSYYHMWSTDFKMLLEPRQRLGVMFAMGDRDRAVTLLEKPEDRSRLGYRWEKIAMFEGPSLAEFLKALIKYVRDGWNIKDRKPNAPSKEVLEFIKSWNAAHTAEPTDIDHYPFTVMAFEKLQNSLKKAAPRDLMKAIDDVAASDESVEREILTQADVDRIVEEVRQLEKSRQPS